VPRIADRETAYIFTETEKVFFNDHTVAGVIKELMTSQPKVPHSVFWCGLNNCPRLIILYTHTK